MKVTVVCATARLGGLDITAYGLKHQTRQPDLFVLVDEWFHLRKKLVEKLFEGLPLKYEFPGWENFGYSRIAQAHNFGAQFADEGLLVWMNDYMYVPPDWLERMETFAETYPDWSLSGAQYRYELPEEETTPTLCESFPMPFDPLHIFSGEPVYRDFRDDLRSVDGIPFSEIRHSHWFGGINDSTLVRFGEQVGWADERLDGVPGGQDTDYAFRVSRLGHRFAFDASLITHEIRGGVHYSPAIHRCPCVTRSVDENLEMIKKYHARIINEGAPLDWREDAPREKS